MDKDEDIHDGIFSTQNTAAKNTGVKNTLAKNTAVKNTEGKNDYILDSEKPSVLSQMKLQITNVLANKNLMEPSMAKRNLDQEMI